MKFFVYLILAAFVLKPILPLIEYAYNKNYIARYLCEKRAEKDNDCQGKCHLKKELAKALDSDEPKNDSKDKTINYTPKEIYFFEKLTPYIFTYSSENEQKIKVNYKEHYNFLQLHSIFHPPIIG